MIQANKVVSRHLTRFALFFAACCAAVCFPSLAPAPAFADIITLGTPIKGVVPSGTGLSATPWVYDFGGANLTWGDDTAEYKGNTASDTIFKNIGSVTSTGVGGSINKTRTGNSTSNVMGILTIELTGSFEIGGYLTNRNSGAGSAGNLMLTAPGGISIGSTTVGFHPNNGASGTKDGSFSILTHASRNPGNVSLFSSDDVTLAAGINMSRGSTTASSAAGLVGNLIVRGSLADVNSRAGAVSIGGHILRDRNTSSYTLAGAIDIRSSGGVTIAGNIRTQSSSIDADTAGSLTIDAQGTVSILGTTGVTLVQRTGDGEGTGTGGATAGSATIFTSFGDIDVTGGFDLGFTGVQGAGIKGSLNLQTTDASGQIAVGTLDVNKVQHASFFAGGSESFIAGELANFDSSIGSGAGSVLDPFVNSQTSLRAAAGQVIYYDYVAAGLNDYLGGMTYRLADLNGVAGAGGLLSFETVPVPEPSTYALTILGLAALGYVRARRRKTR